MHPSSTKWEGSGPWVPSLGFAFRFLLVARLISAFFMHISDCDEVYNYWEPVSSLNINGDVVNKSANATASLYHVREWSANMGIFTCICPPFVWLYLTAHRSCASYSCRQQGQLMNHHHR